MSETKLRVILGTGVASVVILALAVGPSLARPSGPAPFELRWSGMLFDAQVTGTPDQGGQDDDDDDNGAPVVSRVAPAKTLIAPPEAPLNNQITLIILKKIEDSRDMCERIPRRYVIDCLNKQLGAIADELPDSGDLAPAKAALDKAARDLTGIVRQYRDRWEPQIRAEIPGVIQTDAPLTAVRTDRSVAANAAAEAVIAEATTTLLRSASNSAEVAASYERIAAAVDSTKVLLRSS